MTPSSDKPCYKVLLTLLIAPLLLGTKSMPATVKLCESQEPIQEELEKKGVGSNFR
jgi:hypothetical protein